MKKALISAALAATSTLAQEGKIHIDSASRQLQDETGRSVLFHGVNVVYKVDPFIPSNGDFSADDSLNSKDIEDLKTWGMNFVRLGVMWSAVEKEEGIYDDAYLDKIEDLINRLGEAGIYTLVDAHQDVFARTMCGEGMPNFYAREAIGSHPHCISFIKDKILKKFGICKSVLNDYGYTLDEEGNPLISDCQKNNFALYYSSPESLVAFEALWANTNGLQDKFISYWDHTSARFSNNKYVVGYDPINEPMVGNPGHNWNLLKPGVGDKEHLAPMYEKIFNKYQSNSESNTMWFEPAQVPDELGLGPSHNWQFPVGFEKPPGGEIGSDKHVLNDHAYCCTLGAKICSEDGEPAPQYASACQAWHEKRFTQRNADAERLGVPFFMSEFGACLTEGPCTTEIEQVTGQADRILSGWSYWQFKYFEDLTTSAGTGSEGFYNADGTLQDWKVKALSRSYLMATQGVPTMMNFATETGAFSAQYTVDTSVDAPTVVYLNEQYWYPNGYSYVITVDGVAPASSAFTVDETDKQRLAITFTDAMYSGKTVALTAIGKATAEVLQ